MGRNQWFGCAVVFALLVTAAPEVEAKGSVRITFTTSPIPGQYSPRNVVAAWITNGTTHVKTIGLWSAVRTASLTQYQAAAGINDPQNLSDEVDAISGASRSSHAGALTAVWNLRDKANNPVPPGTYTIRLELAESNGGTGNKEGTFTVVVGATPQIQSNLTNGGFTGVTIDFDPNRTACGDGVFDTGAEGCDWTVPGTCVVNQSGCASADKCMPEVFMGDKMMCTARCVPMTISSCVAGDMCCPAGCDEMSDADCGQPGTSNGDGSMNPGGSDPDVSGGCSIGAHGGIAIFGLFALVLARRKHRVNRRRVVRHDAVGAERQ